ncbi:hypothetical protein UXP36_06360 [Enterobacter hormaechei]
MSTITKEFTKEQLIEKLKHRISVASGFPDSEKAQMDLELARIALASLEAEAVAEVCEGFTLRYIGHGPAPKSGVHTGDRLYTAPPAPVSVPDEVISALENLKRTLVNCNRYNYCSDAVKRLENACRSAMLQGAEPVTTANKLPFDQWLSQQTGTIDVECGCVMTEVFFHWLRVAYEAGNYPVIPDGWVLVPIEPTYQMCEAMGLQWESPRFPDRYKAMLAAVKK